MDVPASTSRVRQPSVFALLLILVWTLTVVPDPVHAQAEQEPLLTFGGALRFNFMHRNWERGRFDVRQPGRLEFDTFRLNAIGSYGRLGFSAEYRFYAGYHMIHHGYVGYAFRDDLDVYVGVHQVPFGPLPYASHNWFFQLPYYVGLEDDYDAGIKLIYTPGPWDIQLAYYVNDEGSYTGNSIASARYSYDVVPTTVAELGYAGLEEDRYNREINQFNGRLGYTATPHERMSLEVGISGQWGQLFNDATDRFGSHWATGAHLDATIGRWNLKSSAIRYEMHPANPEGVDNRFVVMGAYDAPYMVTSSANLFLAGLAYTIPIERGPINSVQFYNNYTYMQKEEASFLDTQQNVLGALIAAGPLFIYVDLASGINHPWLGPDYGRALAAGSTDEWHSRFNINIGYYF